MVAAGINKNDPMAEITNPADSVFLYPNFCKTSTFSDTKKKMMDPTK